MLKRYFLLLIVSILIGGNSMLAKPIVLTVGIYDPTGTMPDVPKSPPYVPYVDLSGNYITFDVGHEYYTLCIIDEYDNTVYSVNVPTTLTILSLPSTLSGEYQLRLIPNDGNIYFYGYVMF